MPKYIVYSETPITATPVPSVPGGTPEHPWVPPGMHPEHPWVPPTEELPPPEVWPPIPPDVAPPEVGLPIPPTPEHPIVPLPDDPAVDPPVGIWPPPRPDFPDLSGKSLALIRVYLSRHVSYLAWCVIDHEEAKKRFQEVAQKIKDRVPPRPTPK